MICCVNLINIFFRYHNFRNKKFPEQVINFQFSREPPSLDVITTVWFKHELVQVHSVKYFTDCICGFVYFLNGKFTLGKVLPGVNFSVRYFYTLKEETFAISRFLGKFAKVCSREIFVIYKSRKFILAKVKKSKNLYIYTVNDRLCAQ